jgi:hypothetical protein
MVEPHGGLRRMTPSAPENEDRMQTLVARYPELITDGDGDLLLIRREQPVADHGEGSGRWSLDHLFVTREAVPVLVELKRAVDTRLRREVVGQLLDYAANATAYWQAGRIADSFAATAAGDGLDPEATLCDFIHGRDPADFWNQVDANFKAGRIKLVFVADTIPRELARIVEFLNDQMDADVRAVELRWFSGDGGVTALSPRVIGETERAAAAKSPTLTPAPIAPEAWIDTRMVPGAARTGARAFVALVEGQGGEATVPSDQASINARFTGDDGKTFIALQLSRNAVSLPFGYLRSRLPDIDIRREMLENLKAIVGPMRTDNLNGFPSFDVSKLADPEVASRFRTWLAAALEQMR